MYVPVDISNYNTKDILCQVIVLYKYYKILIVAESKLIVYSLLPERENMKHNIVWLVSLLNSCLLDSFILLLII